MLPVTAGASVAPDTALHAYARARLADSEGAGDVAVASYRAALRGDPDSLEIARRSYYQALESGDVPLALRSATLLDQQGLLPRDGTLLRIAEALVARDWASARQLTDRVVQEGNFAFLAPIIISWIAHGEQQPAPPVVNARDRFGALARRYVDEHEAMQALSRGDGAAAAAPIQRALSLRVADLAGLRLAFAARLTAIGARDRALALLPADDANFTRARADIARGKSAADFAGAMVPRQGFARLLSRLAGDISAESNSAAMALRMARIALFADPASVEARIVAARLLTRVGDTPTAAALARQIPSASWYGALGQAVLVDALAGNGQQEEAVALARKLAEEPQAGPDRMVRLGQLLAVAGDFSGAATAYRAAQDRYRPDAMPWTLLLFEGSALEQAERWDEARLVLERAAKLAPDEAVVLNYLGYAQIERRQNLDAALALLSKASALKPQDASITDSFGWARFLTGDIEGAVPVLERAAAGAPADATINEHLGDALWAAGRRFEARYAWRAASAFAEGETATRLSAKTREGMKPEYAAP
ncbi:MAG: hypothetical protein ABW039_11955 [Sphingobium sp.]